MIPKLQYRSQIIQNWDTIDRYVCSVCWSNLTWIRIAPGRRVIACVQYGLEHCGFVTKSYADMERKNNARYFLEARTTLIEAGILKSTVPVNATLDMLLKSIGL